MAAAEMEGEAGGSEGAGVVWQLSDAEAGEEAEDEVESANGQAGRVTQEAGRDGEV